MSKSLQFRAKYKADIHQLEKILPEDADSLSGDIRNEDIKNHLHRRRVQDRLTHLRTAYDFLGIRRGESLPMEWLEGLTETEKKVFLHYFEHKKGYTKIGYLMGLERIEVKKILHASFEQVMKQVGRD